ncbi:MAG: nucleotidyltransferase family protein [Myxococcota bacterium]
MLRGEAVAVEPAVRDALAREGLAGEDPIARAKAALVLERDVRALAAALADVDHAFFKGALADARWWGGRGLRGCTDIDVLVADGERAGVALRALGYEVVEAGGRASAAAFKARNWRAADRLWVDVHVRLLNVPPFRVATDEVLASARTYDTAFGPLRGPSPEHLLVMGAGNLATGGMTGRLRLALDTACLLTREPLDLALAAATARRWGAAAALWGLLRLVEARFDLSVPLDALAPPAPLRPLVERAFGVHAAPRRPRNRVAALIAVDWPLSGRPLWPAHAVARRLALAAGDRVSRG